MNQLLAGIVRAGVVSSTGRAHGTEKNCADHRQDESQLPPPPSIDRIDENCFPWMQGRSEVSRLELQTTINMSIITSYRFGCAHFRYLARLLQFTGASNSVAIVLFSVK